MGTNVQQGGQHLSFTLGDGDYAVGILQVKEILQYESVTRVPGVPRSVRGVINLRGAVVPVIDVAVRFGFEAAPVTKRTCVLIVEATLGGERVVMGVQADAVKEVLDLAASDIEAPPTFGTGISLAFITGMAKVGKGFVLLLDLDRVLSAGEAAAAAKLAAEEVADAPLDPPAAVPNRPESRPDTQI